MIELIKQAIQRIPFVRTLWQEFRVRRIMRDHYKVVIFWEDALFRYVSNKIERNVVEPTCEVGTEKIIWQYWGQGLERTNLPEVVKICFDSIDRFKGEYRVIRLSDETVRDYLHLPDFVWDKRNDPDFKAVFFSDLLRLALLKAYGGVWLDATVLLTAPLPDRYRDMDHFFFQRDSKARFKESWKASYAYYWNWDPRFKVNMLTSVFFAQKGSPTVSVLLDLMLYYWKSEDKIINYFFFQILHTVLADKMPTLHRCPIIDDTLPHWLQTKLNGGLRDVGLKEIFKKQTIHKLTYFSPEVTEDLKSAIKNHS